jgi:hypothetical protein
MAVGRPMPPLVLSGDAVQQLQSIANPGSLPHSIALQDQYGHRQADGLDGHDRGQVAQALPGPRPGGLGQ